MHRESIKEKGILAPKLTIRFLTLTTIQRFEAAKDQTTENNFNRIKLSTIGDDPLSPTINTYEKIKQKMNCLMF